MGSRFKPESYQKVVDLDFETKLSNWVKGVHSNTNGLCYYAPPEVDSERTLPGALIAMAMIFFDTKNTNLLNLLHHLNPYRLSPDLYMLLITSRSLINFSNVSITQDWICAQYPSAVIQRLKSTGEKNPDHDLKVNFSYYGYTTCGICLSLGLKYMSTQDETVISYIIERIYFFDKTRYFCSSFILSVLFLSLSLVLMGSGHLSFLNLYFATKIDFCYSSQIILNMALGFLFFGGGTCSVDRSVESIIYVFLSTLPIFTETIKDFSQLPLFVRFFWAIAGKPQLLRAIDVEDKNEISLPLSIQMKVKRKLKTVDRSILWCNAECGYPMYPSFNVFDTRNKSKQRQIK